MSQLFVIYKEQNIILKFHKEFQLKALNNVVAINNIKMDI